jgi:hypothetical protein
MHDNPAREPELVPLEVPLPADAARLFGYPGDSRFVGLHWEPAVNEVRSTDGRFYHGFGTIPLFLGVLELGGPPARPPATPPGRAPAVEVLPRLGEAVPMDGSGPHHAIGHPAAGNA